MTSLHGALCCTLKIMLHWRPPSGATMFLERVVLLRRRNAKETGDKNYIPRLYPLTRDIIKVFYLLQNGNREKKKFTPFIVTHILFRYYFHLCASALRIDKAMGEDKF
ncbi:jg13193 [Pararge aegeria aegeria]|uniref:Jg13193 protein n=1 Tax=Pararge aegeria aegeria TaxID=348720 RepID=A0A8S4RCU1_9NEOP|nr:jg13193 [Pararge aegeria aegeria]